MPAIVCHHLIQTCAHMQRDSFTCVQRLLRNHFNESERCSDFSMRRCTHVKELRCICARVWIRWLQTIAGIDCLDWLIAKSLDRARMNDEWSAHSYVSATTLSYAWQDSLVCVTWPIHMSDWCVTWLIHICDSCSNHLNDLLLHMCEQ